MTAERVFFLLVAVSSLLLVAGVVEYQQSQQAELSLVERCTETGGEWLYKSDDQICILPSGEWLTYSLSDDEFVPRVKPGQSVLGTASVSAATTCTVPPEFSDYQTTQSFNGRAQVDFFTNEAALHYRTAITKDVARGVNFAGKYVGATWGCGEGCVGSAIVNGETGKILSYGMMASGYEFDIDSRLLVTGDGSVYQVVGDELSQICDLN